VSLLGSDVWRISRALRLSPELFVLAHDQPEPADDGFLLEPEGWPQGLALDKRGPFAPEQPCVFLVELGGGHARCGIYEHRPAVCRTYPMELRAAATQVRHDALCDAGAWPDDQIGVPSWSAALRSYREQWDEYVAVVEEWNRVVRSAPPGTRYSVPAFLRFLLNRYDERAASDGVRPAAIMPVRPVCCPDASVEGGD
jgi:Fe-S-cluster containining protein